MDAGALDARVAILRATSTPNALNEPVDTWSTLATVWADARPVSDGERWAAGQTLADQAVRFTVRWSTMAASITPKDRLLYQGRTYDIQGIKNLGRNSLREITATARAE
jgi:SPP1 family predicted phage head-tail adaptor